MHTVVQDVPLPLQGGATVAFIFNKLQRCSESIPACCITVARSGTLQFGFVRAQDLLLFATEQPPNRLTQHEHLQVAVLSVLDALSWG